MTDANKTSKNFVNLKARPPKNLTDNTIIPVGESPEVTLETTGPKLAYNLFIRSMVFDAYTKYPMSRNDIVEYLEKLIDEGISYAFIVFNGSLYKYEEFIGDSWSTKGIPYGEYEIVEDVFFTSDTHFGAERTRTLSRRPYLSTKLMDADMISKWYSKVTKQRPKVNNVNEVIEPIVFHLGDVGELAPLKSLPGRKILVKGNYEKFGYFEDFDPYLEVFKQVHMDPILIAVNGFIFELCHEPLSRVTKEFCLFGHIHALQKVKKFGLNVGVDCHNFTPVSFQDVMFFKEAIEKHYDDDVFCTEETITTKEKTNGEI